MKMRAVIRGAGDLASGIALRLHRAGMEVVLLEQPRPTAVRWTVSFSTAVLAGEARVENAVGRLARDPEQAAAILSTGELPVLIDPEGAWIPRLRPDVLVDAILAKRNLGTKMTDAPVVIGVGPGFTAGVDCHAVVETQRGHDLGRVLLRGSAAPNTGIPGNIGGYTVERVLRAPCQGSFQPVCRIGDLVEAGQIVAMVGETPVRAEISGILRGLLPEGTPVTAEMKSGDVDPRCRRENCFTVSDKARAIGGGVLEAALLLSGVLKGSRTAAGR